MLSKTTIQPILWTHRKGRNGMYPIFLLIKVGSERAYIATGISLDESYWDAKRLRVKEAHPLAANHNADLQVKQKEISNKITELTMSGSSINAKELKTLLTSKQKAGNFFDFVDALLEELSTKRTEGTIIIYRRYLLKVEMFHGTRNLSFNDVNHEWLKAFEKSLMGCKKNTRMHIWSVVAMWFGIARKRGATHNNPFSTYEAPTGEIVDKEYLTIPEMDILEAYAVDAENNIKVRTIAAWFLFGCYTGLRVSDWQAFDFKKNLVGDEVRIRTKKNKETVALWISPRLRRVINLIRFMPLSSDARHINYYLKQLVKQSGITKHLSTHCGRKTFAVTVCSSMGIDIKKCAALMGITLEICDSNYYRITSQAMDSELKEKWGSI